jgi:alanine transaminase
MLIFIFIYSYIIQLERCADAFKPDVITRAKEYIAAVPSAGAYTESAGIRIVRQQVADFLLQRDGYAADPNNIILTSGASDAVKFCINCVLRPPISGFKDALMAPIPQYPLYSALTSLMRGTIVPYYTDESRGWACTPENLTESLRGAKERGLTCKALVIINPGNPTGQVLTEENVREVVIWARENGIFLMADEVYQENVHKEGSKFVSFRKVAHDLGAFEGEKKLQLASFHTVSKGFVGECGFRGGYCELLGIPADVQAQILKLSSINLCPNTSGQIMIGLMSNPPKPGDPSGQQYLEERDFIKESLKKRADKLSHALNALENMSCSEIEGAMYAFPSIFLPEKAVAKAKELGVTPDFMYCMQLLEETGVVVVPGSGFGQKEGTFHFRTTILPPEEMMDEFMVALTAFHTKFMAEFK